MMAEVGASSRQTLFIWSPGRTDPLLLITNVAPVVCMHADIKLSHVHVAERDC